MRKLVTREVCRAPVLLRVLLRSIYSSLRSKAFSIRMYVVADVRLTPKMFQVFP